MGCSGSKNSGTGLDVKAEYAKKNLPQPDINTFQNDFEKEAYQVINLIRADPKAMAPYIKQVKSHPYYKGQPIQPLINKMLELDPLPVVTLDENACKACR
jgi:hypothetical protein